MTASQNGANDLSATKGLSPPGFEDPIKVNRNAFDAMLGFTLDNKADDLVLLVGYPWSVIWSEQVKYVGSRKIHMEEMQQLLVDITGNTNAAIDISRGKDLDFTYTLRIDRETTVRFRCNATGCLGPHGRGGMELVVRPTGKIPPTMEQLGLPEYVINAAMPKTGIILVTGPTGSGKTTIMDSFMRAQATHPDGRHILTYYAPIENDLNIIPNKTGLIAQSEIGEQGYGAHLLSFGAAGRNALRRHPMVIAYGEARDQATIEAAVRASMTGHAVYTTTHTPNTHMAIPRMSDEFSGSDRTRISNTLIDNTSMILHQRLLKTPSGVGRAPVRSVIVLTRDMKTDLFRTKIDLLPAAVKELTDSNGISLYKDALSQFEKGKISEDEMLMIEAEMASEHIHANQA